MDETQKEEKKKKQKKKTKKKTIAVLEIVSKTMKNSLKIRRFLV